MTAVRDYRVVKSYLQYYSPGVCPSGYRTVEQATSDSITIATCCPSFASMTYVADARACQLNTMGYVVFLPTTSAAAGDSLPTSSIKTYRTLSFEIGAVQESAVVVAWQASDLSLFGDATSVALLAMPTASTSLLLTASGSNSASTSNPTAAVSKPTTQPSRTTLSNSALRSDSGTATAASTADRDDHTSRSTSMTAATGAALGIVGSFAFMLLLLVVVYVWRRKRAASRGNQDKLHPVSDDDDPHGGSWQAGLGVDEQAIYNKCGVSITYAEGSPSPRNLDAKVANSAQKGYVMIKVPYS